MHLPVATRWMSNYSMVQSFLTNNALLKECMNSTENVDLKRRYYRLKQLEPEFSAYLKVGAKIWDFIKVFEVCAHLVILIAEFLIFLVGF